MQKPSIPKGTRDFSPEEMAKRNYIFNTIREVYHLYGFQQIETPAMENLSTLMGKYGEEGDKLLFKILNSGDCFSGITDEDLLERNAVMKKESVSSPISCLSVFCLLLLYALSKTGCQTTFAAASEPTAGPIETMIESAPRES